MALSHHINRLLLTRLAELALPDCWLVAGCLFQPVWNTLAGWPIAAGINDYDIFYFDAADTSWDAEDRVLARVCDAVASLGIAVDVKNQARVHLWYKQRFGHDYPKLKSASDGIRRFLVAGTCIAISAPIGTRVQLYAPYGLNDCLDGVLRPTPANSDQRTAFQIKVESYRARWPHLRVTTDALPPEWKTATALHDVRVNIGSGS